MPRVTRNFWVEANIDGRSTTLEGGPRGRNGTFEATFYIRDNGSVLRAVTVSGHALRDGTLSITASAAGDVAESMTGHVEPGSAGFTVTTQAGYKPERAPRRTRETFMGPHEPAIGEAAGGCLYLDNDVPTRDLCNCTSCRLVLAAEAERMRQEADNPLGTDPFGVPYS